MVLRRWNQLSLLVSVLGAVSLGGCAANSAKPTDAPPLEERDAQSSGAEGIFKDRHVLPFEPADVHALPGSIVFLRMKADGTSEWRFEPLDGAAPVMKKEEALLFEDLVDRKFVASADLSFFATIKGSMSDEDKAELVIRDHYLLTGPSRESLRSKIDAWLAQAAPLRVIEAYYCRTIRYGTVVSRKFQKVTGRAAVSGPMFNVSGEYYNGSSKFAMQPVITVDSSPLVIPNGPTPAVQPMLPPEIKVLRRWSRDEVQK